MQKHYFIQIKKIQQNIIWKLMFLSLIFLASSNFMVGQTTVRGSVKSESGQVLPGVSILVSGTLNGKTTDANGNYSISVDKNAKSLTFSMIGMNSITEQIGNKSEINVTMISDLKELDEVVVIGYGSQKKSDNTGSISSLKSEDLKLLPTLRVDQALQG